MNLVVNIELGNAAMVTPEEVAVAIARSLRKSSPVWDDGALAEGDAGVISDINGNTVGNWVVQP